MSLSFAADRDPWYDPAYPPSPDPTRRPLPVWDGRNCSRHGAYDTPGCVSCPTTGGEIRSARFRAWQAERRGPSHEARVARAYADLLEFRARHPGSTVDEQAEYIVWKDAS